MHETAATFVREALTADEIRGRAVIEVGSYDVNGSVRGDIVRHRPQLYIGTDITAGPSVDRVVACEDLVGEFGGDSFDVVVSAEMLEHAADWQACVENMVTLLRPGGLLVLTTRSPGMPYHPFPDDHWRFSVAAMAAILGATGLDVLQLEDDPAPSHPGVFVKAKKPGGWHWSAWPPEVVGMVEPVAAPAWWGTDLKVRAKEPAFYGSSGFEGSEGFITKGQIVQAGHPATRVLPHLFELAD